MFENKEYKNSKSRIKEPLDPKINIKSKIDGTIYTDYKNYSGVLTKHCETHGIVTNDVFNYFDLVDAIIKEVKYRCKYCDEWTLHKDYDSGGAITKHMMNAHGISSYDHLKNYPEEKSIFKEKKLNNKIEFENDVNSYINCAICGKSLKRITGTHLKEHNITPTEYRKLYGSTLSNNSKDIVKHLYANNDKLLNSVQSTSVAEVEIADYISKYYTIQRNTFHFGKNINIDIYIPDLNIAIEYCGLYYHSENSSGRNKTYHLNKMKICNDNGVRLITIFADEYQNNKHLVYHKLDHILNIRSKQVIHARKCIIKPVTSFETRRFLDKYHLQGFGSGTVKLGAFYNDSLVSVFVLSKPRTLTKAKYNGYELNRFATNVEYNISGILGRFISYIRKYETDIKHIYSYADLRWTDITKNIYLNNNFKVIKISDPNYWYTYKHRTREHRSNYQKYKLVKSGYDSKLTEREIMISRGYDIIWDCGTILFNLEL